MPKKRLLDRLDAVQLDLQPEPPLILALQELEDGRYRSHLDGSIVEREDVDTYVARVGAVLTFFEPHDFWGFNREVDPDEIQSRIASGHLPPGATNDVPVGYHSPPEQLERDRALVEATLAKALARRELRERRRSRGRS